jgi:hypothetical protein
VNKSLGKPALQLDVGLNISSLGTCEKGSILGSSTSDTPK